MPVNSWKREKNKTKRTVTKKINEIRNLKTEREMINVEERRTPKEKFKRIIK